MRVRPLVLLVPSSAAALELPRRLAVARGALAGLYPLKLRDLARAVAEPALLGHGLVPWDPGHDALLAERLLDEPASDPLPIPADLPRPPIARALALTLSTLRAHGVPPSALARLAQQEGDGARLRALASLYARFHAAIEGRFADPATLLRAAASGAAGAGWLQDAEVLVVAPLEVRGVERDLLQALARVLPVRYVAHPTPAGLARGGFEAWAASAGLHACALADTPLAPLVPPPAPASLERLRRAVFEPPAGAPVRDGAVALVTGAGEAAEARAIVRRLLREAARGVPFEDMAIALPRPETYAPLFADLLARVGIPHRLHPSLPLSSGRAARALLLLLRCRGLQRSAVMEFLTFAPVPFEEMLGPEAVPRPAPWDAISRDAQIVSGLERWIIGLRAHAEAELEAAAADARPGRRELRLRRAADCDALLRVVELLSGTLDSLSGEAGWPEWSDRLRQVLDQWIGPERDRDAVAAVIADLAGLGHVTPRARWPDVEAVIEARLEWERVPLDPVATGAVHVGVLDAIAGLPFRVLAIPGLVEGGYPGVLRPDPLLLDEERDALAPAAVPAPAKAASAGRRQLSLFDEPAPAPAPVAAEGGHALPTTQDRLLDARRAFHRALSQATERLILSYPRADARSGRERMPSLFFVAAACALEGRTLGTAEITALLEEDALDALPLEDALDRGERDEVRVRRGGAEAVLHVAGGSTFFRQGLLAARSRWFHKLTPYDGLVSPLPAELMARLDPVEGGFTVSASRLATFARCGFLYLLQHVLRIEPSLEPEERTRLEPLERGSAFHELAELYLRELRDGRELPVRDTPEARARLLALADAALDKMVAGSPPRFLVLWERERERFRETALTWLVREAAAHGTVPAWFEVGFGLPGGAAGEPHSAEPLEVDLGDGRTLRVVGKIDRIDRKPDGTLVLRDYKTGRAPRDEGWTFKGGQQLQIPFYVLAAARLFPEAPVVDAFLDYVDGGRQVAFDPARVTGPPFRTLLRDMLGLVAEGHFVQEPAACEYCDFTAVCGPRPLLQRRRSYKIGDPRLLRVLRLRDHA